MSKKYLELLEEIGNIDLGDNPYKTFERNKLKNVYNKEFGTINQALLELQFIKESKPSEALEKLDKINNYLNDVYDYKEIEAERRKDIDTIKQALIKAQEQEKVLKIIFEKNVNIGLVKVLGSVGQYNQTYVYDNMRNVKWCLTEEEFDLLKRYCNEQK